MWFYNSLICNPLLPSLVNAVGYLLCLVHLHSNFNSFCFAFGVIFAETLIVQNRSWILLICIADKLPDITLLVEIILKAQVAPIDQVHPALPGYDAYFNFDPILVVRAHVI